MEYLSTIGEVIFKPITEIFIASAKKQYWLYLLANLIFAASVYYVRSKRRSLRELVRYCIPKRLFLHASAKADYKIWMTNNVLLVAAAPALAAMGYASYFGTIELLREATEVEGLQLEIGPMSILIATLVNLITLDGAFFLAHYAQHKVPLLWEFHKTHHSAQVLTPFTVFRMHPFDVFVNVGITIILTMITSGCLVFIFGTNPMLTVLGLNLFLVVFYLLGYHLRHSHVWIMFPGWIGRHISSPALHLIHHSTDPKHHDKNMAQIFTFWDRMAGTLYLPSEKETIKFGIGDGEEQEFSTLADLYFRPFRVLFDRRSRRLKDRTSL